MMHITWHALQSLLVSTVDNHLLSIVLVVFRSVTLDRSSRDFRRRTVLLWHIHSFGSLCRLRLFRTGLVLYRTTRVGIGLLVVDRW
jgi:hypothetical protein